MTAWTLTTEHAAFRLQSHHLTDPLLAHRVVEAVRDSGGIQAQVMNAARLSLRARTIGLTPDMVDGALERESTLAKIWTMRHTVHILPTDDLPIYVSALGNWSADAKARSTTITVEPFGRFPKGVRPALRQEAKDMGRFWGTKVHVDYR